MKLLSKNKTTVLLFFAFIIFDLQISFAQIGIGTSDPSESSLLEIGTPHNRRGLLIPRIFLRNTGDFAPLTGIQDESLLIYNTNPAVGKGFYYRFKSNWIKLSSSLSPNMFKTDGALAGNRIITASSNDFELFSDRSKSNFILKKFSNNDEIGIGFRNSGNFYDATIYQTSGSGSSLIINGVGNASDPNTLGAILELNDDRSVTFSGYGAGDRTGNLNSYLGVTNTGNLVKLTKDEAEKSANSDWYKEGSSNPPNSINENIYTNGKVAINKLNTTSALAISEQIGAAPSFNSGTLMIEREDAGESSITFKSASNPNSDFAYISHKTLSTNENSARSLLQFGVMDDGDNIYRDNININPSGSLGINNITPHPSTSVHMGRTNQGLLVNKVNLTGKKDENTIRGTESDGLLVYNTVAAGTSPDNVTEGFYYWKNNSWNPINSASTTENPVTGVQYYTYNTTVAAQPDLFNIQTTNVVAKGGYYSGNFDGNENTGAFATMATSQADGVIIKMTGTYYANNSGAFTLEATADDGYRIYVDGSLIVNLWDPASENNLNTASGSVNLTPGKHTFTFYYYQFTGPRNFTFSWGANPDGKTGVIKATDFYIE
ncbi:MAG TPA: hypothetical protein ENH91_14300 [Leeuwenhoekiella sp.]|nr:hypothetical protein [Leeuwenhoekiella sp.]